MFVPIMKPSSIAFALIALLMTLPCGLVIGQEPLGQDSEAERSLRGVFDRENYFEQDNDEEDSLADLLRQAREKDASNQISNAIDEADNEAQAMDDDSVGRVGDLLDDDATDELDRDLDDEETEQDQAKAELEASYARQRAMISHLQRLQKPIGQIRLTSPQADYGQSPEDRAEQLVAHVPAQWVTASGASPRMAERYPVCFLHRPLYFEEIDLERCGQSYGCMQNCVSGLQFLLGTAVLPYRLATQRADCEVQTRGDCPTCYSFSTDIEPLAKDGFDPHGMLSEAAAVAGFAFLLL